MITFCKHFPHRRRIQLRQSNNPFRKFAFFVRRGLRSSWLFLLRLRTWISCICYKTYVPKLNPRSSQNWVLTRRKGQALLREAHFFSLEPTKQEFLDRSTKATQLSSGVVRRPLRRYLRRTGLAFQLSLQPVVRQRRPRDLVLDRKS